MASKVISAVIPAFNEEKLLPLCLESLKNQDYRGEYEIIVSDNGSSDGTARVAGEFGARVVSCPRRGVAYAREAGAQAASGDIIAQADADTTYPRDWLSRIAQHFASHPRSVALAGAYVYQEQLSWARVEYPVRHFINVMGLLLFGRPVYISGANFAFRREAFLKTEGYNPESLYPDQWGISRALSRVGKITYDKTLLVSTSTRRVLKPTYLLLGDVVRNVGRLLGHFAKHTANLFRKPAVGAPRLKSSAKRYVAVLLVISACLFVYGYVAPGSQVFGKVYYAGQATDKVVALSFDDGPNEPYTSQILDILDKYRIKATFFAVGRNVELYPQTAIRIVVEGDVIGNHTYSHNANHALTDSDKDIQLAQEAIFKVTGVKPHLYRPPHGKKSPWELRYIAGQYLIEVTWSDAANEAHRRLDFGKPNAQEVASAIISKASPGKIILLHDGYGLDHNNAKSDKSLTVQALPIIIEGLTKQGYRFVTIPELLKIPAYNQ